MRASAMLLLILAAGCATVDDPTERIRVRSQPSGASVTVDCGSERMNAGTTPLTILIDRDADTCLVTLAKQGFAPRRVALRREPVEPAGGFFLGRATVLPTADGSWVPVDERGWAATTYAHVPSEVSVRLDPLR